MGAQVVGGGFPWQPLGTRRADLGLSTPPRSSVVLPSPSRPGFAWNGHLDPLPPTPFTRRPPGDLRSERTAWPTPSFVRSCSPYFSHPEHVSPFTPVKRISSLIIFAESPPRPSSTQGRECTRPTWVLPGSRGRFTPHRGGDSGQQQQAGRPASRSAAGPHPTGPSLLLGRALTHPSPDYGFQRVGRPWAASQGPGGGG